MKYLKKIFSNKANRINLLLVFLILAPFVYAQKKIKDKRANQTYKIKKIGDQFWTVENLNTSTFINGDQIPEAKTAEEWDKAGKNEQPAWCYYDNDPLNGKKYGKLYNFYAVIDPRGLAPAGWHVPTDDDWKKLYTFLGNDAFLKVSSFENENKIDSNKLINSSGFSGLQSGSRDLNGKFLTGGFVWWSSSEDIPIWGISTSVSDDNSMGLYVNNKGNGFSIRCVKNN